MMGNVTSNFLKSVFAQNLFCATFYLNSSECGMTCMKYVQNTFLKGTFRKCMCVLSFLVSARLTTCFRAHTRTTLRVGSIGDVPSREPSITTEDKVCTVGCIYRRRSQCLNVWKYWMSVSSGLNWLRNTCQVSPTCSSMCSLLFILILTQRYTYLRWPKRLDLKCTVYRRFEPILIRTNLFEPILWLGHNREVERDFWRRLGCYQRLGWASRWFRQTGCPLVCDPSPLCRWVLRLGGGKLNLSSTHPARQGPIIKAPFLRSN